MEDLTVVIAGVGAAGVAIGKILLNAGIGDVIGCDRLGAIYTGRGEMNSAKEWFAANTNSSRKMGSISDVMKGADVFVGVSGPDLVTAADVRSMAKNPIVFAMANPNPEIRPEQVDGLATVMATGRSDYPNQIMPSCRQILWCHQYLIGPLFNALRQRSRQRLLKTASSASLKKVLLALLGAVN